MAGLCGRGAPGEIDGWMRQLRLASSLRFTGNEESGGIERMGEASSEKQWAVDSYIRTKGIWPCVDFARAQYDGAQSMWLNERSRRSNVSRMMPPYEEDYREMKDHTG